MTDEIRTHVLTATTTTRPIRLAFVVDPDGLSVEDIDSLTQTCAGYWGGQFWPIVPSDGREIASDWWSVLEAVDPDVVYTVCDLSDGLYWSLQRRLNPAYIKDLGTPEEARERHSLPIRPKEEPLESFEIAAYHLKRHLPPPAMEFLYLTDGKDGPDRRFALRNFGLIRPVLRINAAFKDVPYEGINVDDVDRKDLLDQFVLKAHLHLIFPKDLAQLYAPRPYDLTYDSFARSCHLVVGESIDDALYAWNRALSSDCHAGRDCLWIDQQDAEDPDMTRLVASWISRSFWQGSDQRGATIVSHSVEQELLDSLAQDIRAKAHLSCQVRRLTRGEFPFSVRENSGRLLFPTLFSTPPRNIERVPVSRDTGRLPIPRPPFETPYAGKWMVDLDLEYDLDPPRFWNQTQSWRLPRREPFGGLFAEHPRLARIIKTHQPSVSAASGEASIPLRIPDKRSVFFSLLRTPGSRQPKGKGVDISLLPKQLYPATSEQGRRFRGLVDLFEGVPAAAGLFEEPFWRSVLHKAAGKHTNDRARTAAVVLRELENAEAPFPSADEEALAKLAARVAGAVHSVEAEQVNFTMKHLKSVFHQMQGRGSSDRAEGMQHPWEDEDGRFEWLLDLGVLRQGGSIKCASCGIHNWRIVDALGSHVKCPECGQIVRLPAELEWRYQLNGLVRSALARDSVLPVLHVAHQLTTWSREMTMVFPPQDVREDPEGAVITDLDLVVLADGHFIIGEVKADPAGFDEAQLEIITQLACKVFPDEVVLAAVGTSWPKDVQELIESMQQELAAQGIGLRRILSDW